jgi:putative transposase
MSLLKNIRLSSASKQCAACSGWPAAAGIRGVSGGQGISTRQQFRTLRQRCPRGFYRSKQRYGAPRLTDELRAQGYPFNVKTVAASLRRQGLRKRPPGSSNRSLRTRPVCVKICWKRILRQWPEQKWAGDITYLRTDEGWLYLAVVIDLWSRAVIGWSMSPRMTAQLACDALQMALWRRKGPGTLSFTRTVEASTVQQIIRRN